MAEKPFDSRPTSDQRGVAGGTFKSGPGGTLIPDNEAAGGGSPVPPGGYTAGPAAAGTTGEVREAVAVFDSKEALQAAIDDLAMNGFGQHELSLMAGDEAVRDRLGTVSVGAQDAKHDPAVPRSNIVSPEEIGNAQGAAIGVPAYIGAIVATGAVVATGGTALAAVAAAAAAGAGGGGIGALIARWVGHQHESYLQDHLQRGGILLWVNIRDAEREQLARSILGRHSSHPVEVHTIPQAAV